MTDRLLANRPIEPVAVPDLAREFVRDVHALDAVWRNDLGGLTFRDGDRYLKWNPLGPSVDLEDERLRLVWAGTRHPVPEVLDFGRDESGQLLVTRAIDGTSAVADEWRARPRAAVRAIAEGLRALHELLPAECPFVCGWAAQSSIPVDDLVVIQGDACAPNTLIGPDARWFAHVDLGSLGTADRWADLAVASMSLDWNYGSGWQDEFFAAYGIERDEGRIQLYRALWDDAP